MNSKIFFFVLYVLVLTLAVQYFFPAKKSLDTAPNILLSVADDGLVIPNLPKISLVNTTSSGFSLDSCRDLKIAINSQQLIDIATVIPEFCQTLDIPP